MKITIDLSPITDRLDRIEKKLDMLLEDPFAPTAEEAFVATVATKAQFGSHAHWREGRDVIYEGIVASAAPTREWLSIFPPGTTAIGAGKRMSAVEETLELPVLYGLYEQADGTSRRERLFRKSIAELAVAELKN